MATSPAQLEREALGLGDVVFQGITHIGPAINVVFALPVIAKQAGAAMPVSLLFAVVVCFFIANTVAQFARYVPSSGGYYTFVSRGLGPRYGYVTTWSYLVYEIIGPAAAVGALGITVAGFLRSGTGIDIPWWIISAAVAAIAWVLTYRGIRFSTHATALLGGVEMLIMVVLGFTFLISPGPGSSWLAPVQPSTTANGWSGVLGGTVFSILALSGFEAPAPLAQETKRPSRFIYQAIFLSLLCVGAFYIFLAYTSAIGWGTPDMAAFAGETGGGETPEPAANPYFTLTQRLWGAGWWIILFALLNGTLAVAIACTNAASRVMYTMALAGTLPRALGTIHPVHKTPTFAIHVQQSLQIAAFVVCGLCIGPDLIFDFLGSIATLAVIVLYVLANFALTAFIRREHASEFRIGIHGIVPILGTLLLLPVAFVTLWPVPSPPLNLAPYLFLLLMGIGMAMLRILEIRRPEAFARNRMLAVEGIHNGLPKTVA
jgi:amino acid transporter